MSTSSIQTTEEEREHNGFFLYLKLKALLKWLKHTVAAMLIAGSMYIGVAQPLPVYADSVGDYAALVAAINAANLSPDLDTITLTSDITLSDNLPLIKSNIVFECGNHFVSGNNTYRVFFVGGGDPQTAPTVTFRNLTIQNGKALGGSGNGGGAGLGGGLFVYDGNVTTENVHFDNNWAAGGTGNTGLGGGGGMGGSGGGGSFDNGGGGGLWAVATGGNTYSNGGSAGNYGGGGGGGATTNVTGNGGGFNGGVGNGDGGSGGGGGMNGANGSANGAGGAGGWGGGGGGFAQSGNGGFGGGGGGMSYVNSQGGNGGWGGGGGLGFNSAGKGGFGGGGASAGFGGGNHPGGGAGLGGGLFARAGTLTLKNVAFNNNSASHGTGANNGLGKGGGLFILDRTTNGNGNDQGMPATLPSVTAASCGVTFFMSWAQDAGSLPTDNANVFGNLGSATDACSSPASLVVDSPDDGEDGNYGPGQNTLREAIANANPGDTVTFDASLIGQTITLTSQLDIATDLTIDGTGHSVTINGNNAAGPVFNVTGGNVTFRALTITGGNNTGGDGGGIAISNAPTVSIDKCAITGNQAQNGGGIAVGGDYVPVTIINSTIAGNTATTGAGGGIYSGGNSVTIVKNTTIANNDAATDAGGVYFYFNTQGYAQNTLIVNNTSGGGTADCHTYAYGWAADVPGSHVGNLMEAENSCGAGSQAYTEPLTLADNGGDTPTFALLYGNSAVDAGDLATCLPDDQRGIARPQGATCDAGAYELIPPTARINGTYCDLIDAITAANTDIATGDCAAGSGADTIELLTDMTLNAVNNSEMFTRNGLPVITSTITISGGGHTIARDAGAESFRFFEIDSGGGDLTLNAVTLTGGKDTVSAGGGAILNYGSLALNNSTLNGNIADQMGGGIYNMGTLRATNSTLRNNTAGSGGGGIFDNGTTTWITNSTVSGNAADYGGGLYASVALTLTNSTIASNTVATQGGGLYGDLYGDLVIVLERSLMAGNIAAEGQEIYGSGAGIIGDADNLFGHSDESNAQAFFGFTPGTSDIVATSDGTTPTALAAILGPLADNGGGTWTHALVAGSPAIDAAPSGPATDQRGVTRPQGVAYDIGAYEVQTILLAVPGGQTSGLCQSWADACELRYALTSAISGQEIWVTAGTYKPTAGTDHTATFQLKNGVALYGGFAGGETLRTERNSATNVTILSGDIGTVGNNGDNAYHVVIGATGAILDGFTITAGNANDTGWHEDRGGGMYNENISNLSLTNLTFSGNSARWGAGMSNENISNLSLTNVTFSSNSGIGDSEGGGMMNWSSNPSLTNVTFSGNWAKYGGGMSNRSSGPTLTNVTFRDNSSSGYGGGMLNQGSNPQIRNSIFWGNAGEQIYNDGSSPVVSDSVVQGGCPSGSTCTNIISTDPLLGPLGNYGGGTQTIPLLLGSAAIDAGDNATCASTDQRGVPRPQGAACDIGAYEVVQNARINGTNCDLIDAITAANTDTATGACNAGNDGADTITLLTDVTLTSVNTTDDILAVGLPPITSTITIEGSGHTITRTPSAPAFGILYVDGVDGTGDLTLNDTTISGAAGDSATFFGGGILNGGALTLNKSTVSGNNGYGFPLAGGITNIGIMTLTNSTVSGNSGEVIGGISNLADATLNHCTVSGNTGFIGGIYNGTTLTLTHSLVAGNSGAMAGEIYSDGSITSDDYNLFGHSGVTMTQAFVGVTPGASDLNATSDGGGTPTALANILGPLADNGGGTWTHALVAGSPAIDAAPTGPATDQRGVTRPQGVAYDIGAYEALQHALTVSVTGNGVVTSTPAGIAAGAGVSVSSFVSGTVVTLTAMPNTGWSFAGWSGAVTTTTNPLALTMDASKAMTATFTQNQYTLTMNVAGSGVVTPSGTTTYTYDTVVTLTAMPGVGWSFAGWSGAVTTTTNPLALTMDASKAMTATFTQNQYTLAMNVVGSGIVTPSGTTTYTYGAVVTLTAMPSVGWSFAGWSGAVTTTTNPLVLTMNADKVVAATFKTYKLLLPIVLRN